MTYLLEETVSLSLSMLYMMDMEAENAPIMYSSSFISKCSSSCSNVAVALSCLLVYLEICMRLLLLLFSLQTSNSWSRPIHSKVSVVVLLSRC